MPAAALVSPGWVAERIQSKDENIRVLDASWRPNTNTYNEYQQAHIPGALFFDIVKCAAPGGPKSLAFTLPSPEAFAAFVGQLGIGNDSHVVIYENNPKFGVYSAARAWWMFRTFGHDNVSVIDGGLPLWVKEGRGTTDAAAPSDPAPAAFKASYRPGLYKSFSDVEANLKTGSFQLMDARPEGMFKGTMPYPREGVEPGHVPNALSLPFTAMIQEQDGTMKLKPVGQLKEAFAGVDLAKPLAAMCGSGVSSCILVLAAFLVGREDVALFDGSWEEYYLTMQGKNPQLIVTG